MLICIINLTLLWCWGPNGPQVMFVCAIYFDIVTIFFWNFMSLSDAMRYLNTCVTISNHPPLPLKISKYTSMMLGSIWTPTFSIYTSQYFRPVLANVSLLDYCYLFVFDILKIIMMKIWFGDIFSPHKMWYKLKGALHIILWLISLTYSENLSEDLSKNHGAGNVKFKGLNWWRLGI